MTHFAAWYRREDYKRIRRLMDDGDELPANFDAWEKVATSQLAEAKKAGVIIQPVILQPEEFIAYCKAEKMPCSGQARAQFVVVRGSTQNDISTRH